MLAVCILQAGIVKSVVRHSNVQPTNSKMSFTGRIKHFGEQVHKIQ